MTPPTSILSVLEAFRPEFTPRTWARALTLILGTILARGRRTVAAALRQMGLHEAPDFGSYHQVTSRAAWSPRKLARRLLSAAIAASVPERVGLTFAIDETLERRWGKKIRIRGHYRDPLASSKGRSVSASGIRRIVLALIVTPPRASRPWALPILSLPCPTPRVSTRLGRRHKTIAERARRMIARLRRWLPGVPLTIVGDSAYSVIELGLACRRRGVGLIAPLRLDARLFKPAPERAPGTVGRPRVAGERLPNLDVVQSDPKTAWAWGVVRGAMVRRGRSGPGDRQRDGGVVPQRVRAAADPPGLGAGPGRAAGAEGLFLDAARGRGRDDPGRGRQALADRGHLRSDAGPPRGRDATAVVGPGDRAGDAVHPRVVLGRGPAGRRPAHGVADRDPGGGPVPEGGGDILGRAGGGASGMLGYSGYSDITGRPIPCGNPEVAARSPARRGMLRPLTRTKSS